MRLRIASSLMYYRKCTATLPSENCHTQLLFARTKLCVNHATQGLTLFHGLYPRQASLYPVFLSAPTWKRLPQPSQTGNKRKAQDTCKNLSLRVIFARILGLPQICTVFRPDR